MLKVPRLSVSMRYRMRCSMRCSMSCSMIMMRTMFLLVVMLMVSSVSGRAVENLWDEGEAVLPRDDSINNGSRQDTDTVLCGRRPAMTSKRHVGDEPTDTGDTPDQLDKLLGSIFTLRGEVPWQVGVYSGGYFICSGAILNEFWVVTTAGCVYGLDTVDVEIGDFILESPESGQQRFHKDQIYIMGGFEGIETNLDYDLALIKIANSSDGRGIRFNNYVQPICLPEVEESPDVGTMLTISGWGQTDRNREKYYKIMELKLPVLNHTVCQQVYKPGSITDRKMCAGSTDTMGAACFDDYGDPATYKSGDIHILAGLVTSAYHFCQQPSKPIILTSIPAHLSWINTTITYLSSNNQGVLPSRT